MQLRIVVGVIGLTIGGLAAWPAFRLYQEAYPSDFRQREALDLCARYSISFNRLDHVAREECYRAAPLAALGETSAPPSGFISPPDFRQPASRATNDIRIIQETDRVHGR